MKHFSFISHVTLAAIILCKVQAVWNIAEFDGQAAVSVQSDGGPAVVSVSSTRETAFTPSPTPSLSPKPSTNSNNNLPRSVPRKWRRSMAYIVIRTTNGHKTCTGTVLDKAHILTSASCSHNGWLEDVSPRRSYAIIGASSTEMYLDADRNDKISIRNIFFHTSFQQNGVSSRNDIAIVRLKENIKDRHYKPASLVDAPTATPSDVLVATYEVYNDDVSTVRTPKYALMQYQSANRCNRRTGGSLIKNNRVCVTSSSRASSSCFASSGSPIFLESGNRMALFGLVSEWDADCESDRSITLGAKLSSYRGMIDRLVQNNDQSGWSML